MYCSLGRAKEVGGKVQKQSRPVETDIHTLVDIHTMINLPVLFYKEFHHRRLYGSILQC